MKAHETFDPYVKWLGIRCVRRPPNHYRLLGLDLFETDGEVISHAADARITHLRTFLTGPHRELAEKILQEVQTAKVVLLDAEKKAAYDEQLRAEIARGEEWEGSLPSVVPPPLPPSLSGAKGAWTDPVEESAPSGGPPPCVSGESVSPRTLWMAVVGVIVLLLLVGSILAVVAARRARTPEIAEQDTALSTETLPSEEGASHVSLQGEETRSDGKKKAKEESSADSLSSGGQTGSGGTGTSSPGSDSGKSSVSGTPMASSSESPQAAPGQKASSESSPAAASSEKGEVGPATPSPEAPPEKTESSPAETTSAQPVEKPGEKESSPEKGSSEVQAGSASSSKEMGAEKGEKTSPPAEASSQEKPSHSEEPSSSQEKSSQTEAPSSSQEKPSQPGQSSSQEKPSSGAERARWPVPSSEEQKRAEAIVRDLFQKELAAAKSPAEKLVLADRLQKEALATQDDPPAAYVLLGLASGLAVAGGDLRKSFEIIDMAAERFAIQPISMKLEILDKALVALRTSPQPALLAYELADLALMIAEEAVLVDEIDQAIQAHKLASSIVKRSGDNELIQEVFSRNRCMQVLEKQYPHFRAAEKQLATSPKDPGANATVGRWHCFWKGLWEKGLPYLVWAESAELAQLAQDDLKSPEDPKVQFQLAERWLQYAASESEEAKGHIQLRAAYWYRQALPDLTGFDKLTAEKQLEKLPTTPPLFTRRQRGEVASGNVALEMAGAKITGPNTSSRYLIDGQASESNPAYGPSPCTWTIILPKLYSLREIRFLVVPYGRRPKQCGYILAVSSDGKRFTPLVDRSKGQWLGWQVIRFPARPVRAIQLIGFQESGDRTFSVAELEAYCIPPNTPAGTPPEPASGVAPEDSSSGPRKKKPLEDPQEKPVEKPRRKDSPEE